MDVFLGSCQCWSFAERHWLMHSFINGVGLLTGIQEMEITCISDLHGHYPQLEGGDLLIVAGDLTATDSVLDHMRLQMWLHEQNYKKRIIIAGNHDNRLQKLPFESIKRQYAETGEDYLCDSGTEFQHKWTDERGILCGRNYKIWGSPWTLRFEGMNPNCMAFTCETEEEIAQKWALIPDDVDILITHSPPFTIQDMTIEGKQAGSISLMVQHIQRLRPKLWVFGHIHEAYGTDGNFAWNDTIYVNASHINERYEPVNKPIRIEL